MRNMKLFPKLILCLLLILFLYTTTAQDVHFWGVLPTYTQTTPLSKKFDWLTFFGNAINPAEHHFQALDYPGADVRLQFNNGLVYKPSKNISVTAGLIYQSNFAFEDRRINEWRPYQQLIVSHFISTVKISHRFRFSERFIQNKATGNYPLTTMLQYNASFLVPLKGKTIEPKEFYTTFYADNFFFLSGPNKFNSFGEFWTNASLGYNFGKMGKVQTGFTYEWLVRDRAEDKRRMYLFTTDYITNFDIFGVNKKKK